MRPRWAPLAAVAILGVLPATAPGRTSSAGVTTARQTIGGNPALAYSHLELLPGWKRVVRRELATPKKGRNHRRRSLIYFAQLTDFQLADEESPARVEALDIGGTPFTAAWRPQEALGPFTVDQVVRQINRFQRSPIPTGRGGHARLRMTLVTGDNTDNKQVNEVKWVVRLLEGGRLDPNSGVEGAACALGVPKGEAARYTGVQDDNDVGESGRFYDPNRPSGDFAAWPRYPGLMDRAQLPFTAAGLRSPSYVAFGNHDGNVQGNLHALAAINSIAIGCLKPLQLSGLSPSALMTSPANSIVVPPDPERRFADIPTYKALHDTGHQADAHGFADVDPAELKASDGNASYYSFSPRTGIRFISINTVAEGDTVNSNGNLDAPQFAWLGRELDKAEAANELVILFGHHPIRTLDNHATDETAGPCSLRAITGPGCDLDPRSSSPIKLGPDLQRLLLAHPHVIAYVAGHTHRHRITPFARADGRSGFWGIETASEVDWPIQSRLLDVMDNRDGTLSIFGTIVDHGGTLVTPPPGTSASGFGISTLAALAREFSYNDPQIGFKAGAEGGPQDRNVELLLPDPRR